METSFSKHLRNSLNHLYDLDYLRQSPLIIDFGIINRFDVSSVLQRLLVDAIENLRPGISEPPLSENRKIYEILYFRYIQQFKQEEVAHHIGVSARQFRREQNHALDVLATLLWNRYHHEKPAEKTTSMGRIPPGDKNAVPTASDWEWVKESHAERVANLKMFTSEIQNMMQPVAAHYNATIQLYCSPSVPELSTHPVAARQILLNLLQAAINHSAAVETVPTVIVLRVEPAASFVEFQITTSATQQVPPSKKEQQGNLVKAAAYLAQLSGGRLTMQEKQIGFACQLMLPSVNGIAVVAMDDNRDILELLERYTAGTRYHLIGSNQAEHLIDLVVHTQAQIIVLDVMMPKIDGWELLGRLRRHPQTAHVPVIILTILDQEELALSLGARALVLKPVTQDRFLAALDEVFADLS